MSDDFSARLLLARSEIDRDHLGRVAGIDEVLAREGLRVVVLHDGRALLAGPAQLALLPLAAVPAWELALYLGLTLRDAPDAAAGTPIAALVVDAQTASDLEGLWGDLRRIGARLDTRDAGLFTEALALANWHASYGFSPRTGNPTAPGSAGWTRLDPDDGRESFPRTDPAIIVGVTDADDRLLLGRNAMWEGNRFSLLAGFVEPGESLEAAVIREVFEESGIRVADPVYLGSQPWPFPASIMLGFRARVADGASIVGAPDGEEILEVRWFRREELVAALGEILLPGPASIARAIIEDWYGAELDDGSRA